MAGFKSSPVGTALIEEAWLQPRPQTCYFPLVSNRRTIAADVVVPEILNHDMMVK
jgi:hypothetical protein